MDSPTLKKFRDVISKPNGIILVTGPTGSGKTTTLYSALNELNKIEDKLITTEDPVEYDMQGIIQVPIDSSIGNTFAHVLRSILRQDPDKILVGEIRDLETAEIAVQASLTGHMVFSTLHTNDAASAVTRLLDMGVEPFLISSSVLAIMAQRLVRLVCQSCREPVELSAETLRELGLHQTDISQATFVHGRGCNTCRNTGYRGRTGIYELLVLDDPIRTLVMQQANANMIKTLALQRGMRTLMLDGANKVCQGLTTAEEILRVTQESD
jgi:type IV pilus assembly protein PilB